MAGKRKKVLRGGSRMVQLGLVGVRVWLTADEVASLDSLRRTLTRAAYVRLVVADTLSGRPKRFLTLASSRTSSKQKGGK